MNANRARAAEYEHHEEEHPEAQNLGGGVDLPNNNSSPREERDPDDEQRSLDDADCALIDSQGRQRCAENSKSPNDFPSSKKIGTSSKKATKTPKKTEKAGAKKGACSPKRGKRLARLVDEGVYNAMP